MKLYKYVSEGRYEPVIEIPDNPTNGEVFKKVFPNAEVDETNRGFVVLKLKATHNGEPYTDSTAIWNSIWYGKWGE